jgi:hypothetical protein
MSCVIVAKISKGMITFETPALVNGKGCLGTKHVSFSRTLYLSGGSGADADPTDFQIKQACDKCPNIDIPLPKPKEKPPEFP